MKTKPAYHTSAEMQHTSVLIDSNSETSRENIKSKRSGKNDNKNRNYFLGAGFVVLFLFVLFSVNGRDEPKNVEKSVMDWFSGKKQAETVPEITELEVFKIDTTPFELPDFTSTTNAPTTEKPTTTQELTTTTRENLEKLVETTTASPSSWGSWVWGEKQAETVSEITESGISQVTTAPLKRIDFNRYFTSNSDEIPEFVQAVAVLETTESVEPEASGLLAESPVTSSKPEATTTTTVEPLSTNAPTTEKPTTTRKLTTTTNENVEKSVSTTTPSPSSWGSWVWGKKQAETVSEITESNVSPVTTAEPETTTATTIKPTNAPTTKNPTTTLKLTTTSKENSENSIKTTTTDQTAAWWLPHRKVLLIAPVSLETLDSYRQKFWRSKAEFLETIESDVSPVTSSEPETTTTTTVKPTNAPTTKKPTTTQKLTTTTQETSVATTTAGSWWGLGKK